MSAGHVCLDASRPWLIYWISHSLCLLGIDFFDDSSKEMASRIVDTIGRCVSKDTTCGEGVGGGPQQLPHLAPTYAATLALCTVGTEDALKLLNRSELYKWFMSLKNKDGSFAIHRDGESDIRSSYLLLAVAKILNILTPELAQGAADFVNKCQSMMGGFGGEPGNEGHGGYAFNGVASLAILDRLDLLRVSHFDRWVVFEREAREFQSFHFFMFQLRHSNQEYVASLTHTARKSLENQRSNTNSIMKKT